MSKTTIKLLHRIAAITSFLLVLSFFTSSIMVELFGDITNIIMVKTAILCGICALIPAMAITGITGAKMAVNCNKGPIAQKKKRMPFIAINGLFILLPCAFYLFYLASNQQVTTTFYIVQVIELIAGFTNLTLMALNIRDSRKRR
ncbi:hypothetical protein PMAL9190_01512 [Photobacterium malacitanum]|uniref:Uncharacterized protein n=1 Tax=Photobacterium malacitanum TaxID=2204294 RepID=A0A1Y6MCA4_9GAMM|nr:hypothetical protein [Photobacterium malacitanum]SMY34132.1 hypothetical protein PMAL9190_01512 [Photobacterium malacitanum]